MVLLGNFWGTKTRYSGYPMLYLTLDQGYRNRGGDSPNISITVLGRASVRPFRSFIGVVIVCPLCAYFRVFLV